MEQDTKPFYLSKTFWLNAVMLVAMAVPAAKGFIEQYFSEVGMGWALINMVLRLVSKERLSLT